MFAELTPQSLDCFRRLYYYLAPRYTHSVLLDSCGWEGKTGGFYLMGFDPEMVIQLQDHTLWVNGVPQATVYTAEQLWEQLESIFPPSSAGDEWASFPFVDGWVGTLGYELNHFVEPSVPYRDSENSLGALYFVRFRHRVVWQPTIGQCEVFSSDPTWRVLFEDALAQSVTLGSVRADETRNIQSPRMSLSQPEFEALVSRLKDHIVAGDIYQANLSIRFEVPQVSSDSLFLLYETLVNRNPSPFSGIFYTPNGVVLSNSPERLVKYNQHTDLLETRPIAGTRGRGKTAQEESSIAHTLSSDPKEQAEHIMLVDLERNDLGRVARPGTVYVPEVGVLERYSHVTHLVSQVEAEKDPQKTRWDVLEALFPGGTITGCPKLRCMEILAETEPVPRGLYTGSLGYLDSRGNLDFNILIRSLFHWPDNRLHFHAGAGIVADSVPAWEYRECLRKAEVIQGVLYHDNNPSAV